MFAMRRKLLVGIDIGTHSLKVVRLKQGGNGYQWLNVGIMPLRPEAVVDGNIAETDAIVEAIRNLMRMEKNQNKRDRDSGLLTASDRQTDPRPTNDGERTKHV